MADQSTWESLSKFWDDVTDLADDVVATSGLTQQATSDLKSLRDYLNANPEVRADLTTLLGHDSAAGADDDAVRDKLIALGEQDPTIYSRLQSTLSMDGMHGLLDRVVNHSSLKDVVADKISGGTQGDLDLGLLLDLQQNADGVKQLAANESGAFDIFAEAAVADFDDAVSDLKSVVQAEGRLNEIFAQHANSGMEAGFYKFRQTLRDNPALVDKIGQAIGMDLDGTGGDALDRYEQALPKLVEIAEQSGDPKIFDNLNTLITDQRFAGALDTLLADPDLLKKFRETGTDGTSRVIEMARDPEKTLENMSAVSAVVGTKGFDEFKAAIEAADDTLIANLRHFLNIDGSGSTAAAPDELQTIMTQLQPMIEADPDVLVHMTALIEAKGFGETLAQVTDRGLNEFFGDLSSDDPAERAALVKGFADRLKADPEYFDKIADILDRRGNLIENILKGIDDPNSPVDEQQLSKVLGAIGDNVSAEQRLKWIDQLMNLDARASDLNSFIGGIDEMIPQIAAVLNSIMPGLGDTLTKFYEQIKPMINGIVEKINPAVDAAKDATAPTPASAPAPVPAQPNPAAATPD